MNKRYVDGTAIHVPQFTPLRCYLRTLKRRLNCCYGFPAASSDWQHLLTYPLNRLGLHGTYGTDLSCFPRSYPLPVVQSAILGSQSWATYPPIGHLRHSAPIAFRISLHLRRFYTSACCLHRFYYQRMAKCQLRYFVQDFLHIDSIKACCTV